MFCSTLRKRKDFGALVTAFENDKKRKWTETELVTHDITLPLPPEEKDGPARQFRVIVLSEADIHAPGTRERIEKLYNLGGAKSALLYFYLNAQSLGAMDAYMELQMIVLSKFLGLSVLPFNTMEQLPGLLRDYETNFLTYERDAAANADDDLDILPYCTITGERLSDDALEVICSLTTSVDELGNLAKSKHGRTWLRQYIEPSEAEKLIRFFVDKEDEEAESVS